MKDLINKYKLLVIGFVFGGVIVFLFSYAGFFTDIY